MRIYHSTSDLPKIKRPILTQGTFDGVHMGHKKILNLLKARAQSVSGETVVLTFFPHPRMVLYPDDNSLKLLSTLDEKAQLLEEAGIDHLLVLPFTGAFSRMTPEEFVKKILVDAIGVSEVVVGYDHRFGRNREGTFHNLVEFGEMFNFKVLEIPANQIDDVAVSSTRIRNAIAEGNIEVANKYLGRPYSLVGTVVHGKKLGRQIGFPTANILVTDIHKLIPGNGVYAVETLINGKTFFGAMNIGENPTIPGKGYSLEVHLFDFQNSIYDIAVQIRLRNFLRPEQKFKTVEDLKTQIAKDVKEAKVKLGLL